MPRFVSALLCVTLLAGCNHATDPDDGLTYNASTTVVNERPMVVRTSVTVRNTSRARITIETNACPTWLEGYLSPRRDGPSVWRAPDPGSIACLAYSSPLHLEPGDKWDLSTQHVLPAAVLDGVYFLSYNLSVRGQVAVRAGQVTISQGAVSQP